MRGFKMCFNVFRMLGLVGEKVVTWLDREGGLQKYHTNFSQVTKLQGYKFKPSYQVTKLQPYKIIKTIKKLLIKNRGDVMNGKTLWNPRRSGSMIFWFDYILRLRGSFNTYITN